jgi:ankyrin repeat protein
MKRLPTLLFVRIIWSAVFFTTLSLVADTAVLSALKSGDLNAFRHGLQNTPDLNAVDERGFTALMYATRHYSTREMKALLDQGADCNVRSKDKFTAFNFAVPDVRKAQLLIDRGFNFKYVDTNTPSALMIAARHPRGFEVAKLLVSKGADVNAKGPSGATALNKAVSSGDVRIVKLLVDNGADVRSAMKYDDGSAGIPLLDSIYVGNDEIARFLIAKGADLNVSDGFAGHSLAVALVSGNTAIARELIERGADIRLAKGIGEVPPVVFAAHNERGDSSMVKLLLEKGADLGNQNDNDESALTWAKKRGSTELVRFLTEKGVQDKATPRKRLPIPSNDVRITGKNRDVIIKTSVQKSLSILQKGSAGFMDREGRPDQCVSCHSQTLPGIAFGWAASRGLGIDSALVKRQLQAQTNSWRKVTPRAWAFDDPVGGGIENVGPGMLHFAAIGYAEDEITEAMSFYLAGAQLADGGWISFFGRPPAESTRLASTAMALRSLQAYPLKESKTETERRKQSARDFLHKQKTFTSEEGAFKLLGLLWAGAGQSELKLAARDLLSKQRADGGWSQIPTLESDAYATGQTLVALTLSGQLSTEAPEYIRAAEFLLRTQFDDGSWLVKSRTWPFQAHFSSGFPHGRDQWISSAGTTWATLALMTSLDPSGPPAMRP